MNAELPVAVLAVSGMAFEARIAAHRGARAVYRDSTDTLATTLGRVIGEECRGLISFGVAGGLAPHLRVGTCIVASAVLGGARPVATDREWSRNLLRTIPGAVYGEILGVPAPVVYAHEKHALHARTGAMAVDMESHVVADIAAARGLPMAAVRVISDCAARTLPQSAVVAMRSDGTVDVRAMIRAIARTPSELPMLFRTARDALVSHVALRRSRRRLDASFGLPPVRRPTAIAAE